MATPSAKPKSDDQTATQQPDKNSKDFGVTQELVQQHHDIRTLLANAEKAEIGKLLQQLVAAWVPHTLIEEEILIPALEKAGAQDDPAIVEADIQRDIVKLVLSELLRAPEAKQAPALLALLTSQLSTLIEIEERPENGVLALAAIHGIDLEALRPEIDQRKAKIQTDTKGTNSQALEPISLRLSGSNSPNKEYSSMATSNYRERDEEGRFRSDDDRRGGYRDRSSDRDRDEQGRFVSDDRGYSSRSRSDYDDDRRSGGRGGDRYRDDEGRFASDDRSRYARSERDYRDDDRRDYGRGEGRGWYGDPEGHSEASRRGWESREGAGYSSRSERDYDDRRHDRGGSNDRPRDDEGRFVSDDRYSSRSSRDDDRGYRGRDEGRGWHGDPEGHSAASRRGWEAREGGGYSARSSRYEEDDDRRGGGRDHGGWFGDSRGHSEAARRGWEDRR